MTDRAVQQVELDGGVAVGVDNSQSSLPALTAAAEEAELRGSVLHVVCAWSLRTTPRPTECPRGSVPSMDQYHEAVLADTERFVACHLGAEPRIEVRVHVAHSPSPQALLSASRGAELLVVGSRERGFAGRTLGAVATQCVRYAACPVLAVRPKV